MGNYSVIADAGKSIISLLRREMIPEPVMKAEDIELCSPDEQSNSIIGLHLYDIEENPEVRNGEKIVIDREHFKNPPTSLNLYYMVFVKMKSESTSKAIDEQILIGKTIQVLNDNGRIQSYDLEGTLNENDEFLDMQSIVLTFEEKQKIYSLFENKKFLSCFYKVGPVFIDSEKIRRVKRVSQAIFDIKDKKKGW